MISYPLLGGYCVLVILASLAGGGVPMVVKLTHRRLQIASSIIGGFMLGVALLHLLPHALAAIGPVAATRWLLAGLLVMFLLERFFHFHQHEVAETERDPHAGHDQACEPVGDAAGQAPHFHAGLGEAHHHSHEPAHVHDHVHVHEHRMSWSGAAVGLVLHSMIAGAALAASMAAEQGARWAGLAVFLVIVLHKPLDSMTLLTLMTMTGWGKASRHVVNALFALAVPAGAVLFMLGLAGADLEHSVGVGAAVAFAAGVFLTVSLSDVLPELRFHAHDKLTLSAALLVGVALAWVVSAFEMHTHEHEAYHVDHGHEAGVVDHEH